MATPRTAHAPREKQEKPTFHIHLVVVTDGCLPGRDNIRHISTYFQEGLQRMWNIAPQHPRHTGRRKLSKEVLEVIAPAQVTVKQAMMELKEWLERFKGRRVLICSPIAFWHTVYHMTAECGEPLPFSVHCVEPESYIAGGNGTLDVPLHSDRRTPAAVMVARVQALAAAGTGGGMKGFKWS